MAAISKIVPVVQPPVSLSSTPPVKRSGSVQDLVSSILVNPKDKNPSPPLASKKVKVEAKPKKNDKDNKVNFEQVAQQVQGKKNRIQPSASLNMTNTLPSYVPSSKVTSALDLAKVTPKKSSLSTSLPESGPELEQMQDLQKKQLDEKITNQIHEIITTKDNNKIINLVNLINNSVDAINPYNLLFENSVKIFNLSSNQAEDSRLFKCLVSIAFKHMKSYQLLSCKKILESISKLDSIDQGFKAEIGRHIENAYTQELIDLLLTSKMPKINKSVFSHFWFITTENFIKTLVQKLWGLQSLPEYDKQAPIILEFLKNILNSAYFYLISSKFIAELFESTKALPDDCKSKKEMTEILGTCLRLNYFPRLFKQKKVEARSKSFDSIVAPDIEKGKVDVLTFKQLANDLKNRESKLLSRIRSQDIVEFQQNPKSSKAVRMTVYIEHSNALGYEAQSNILSSLDSLTRTKWCEFYIQLATHSIKIRNFNSAFVLFNALTSVAIYPLNLTWSHVNSSVMKEFESLQKIFEPNLNFKNYKDSLETEDKKNEHYPIPVFSFFLKELTFTNENRTILISGHLNKDKMILLAKSYQLIQDYQAPLLKLKKEIAAYNSEYELVKNLDRKNKYIADNFTNSDEAFTDLVQRAAALELKIDEDSYISIFDVEDAIKKNIKDINIAGHCEFDKKMILKLYVVSQYSSKELSDEILGLVPEQIRNKITCQVHFIDKLPVNSKGTLMRDQLSVLKPG